MFNQGFTVYETTLTQDIYNITMKVNDFAVVYQDSDFVGSFDRSQATQHTFAVNCKKETCKLIVLVEAMGHINFDHGMETDFKGLISFEDSKKNSFRWNIYKINIDKNILSWRKLSDKSYPSLSKATFNLT